MSYLVNSVEIYNLWGNKNKISFKCYKDFNFLIGDNGTGKTTIINLLAAVLTGNSENLRKIQFSSIIVYFSDVNSRKKPSIRVNKLNQETSEISYEFKHSQLSEPLVISQLKPTNLFENIWGFQNSNTQTPTGQIKKILNDFIHISFLPINRFIASETKEKELKDSSIDSKMDELNENLVKFFSKLSKEYTDCISEFQKKTLLSVLTPEKTTESLVSKAREINIEDEKNALLDMFSVLGINKREHAKKMETHLSLFERARIDVDKRGHLTISDLLHIYNTWRTHSLVQEYELLQQEKQKIFQQKDLFLLTVNNLFNGRKIVSISEKNELRIMSQSNDFISLKDLSSGEKQILILLGEALLQEQRHVLYIADEPELSLHIKWQEQLTSCIKKINTNAQIIFATHSPDIVGIHGDKIIDMGKI